MRILLAVLVIGGVCRASDGDSPATSAAWTVPHWEPILTSPEALPQRYGHVQGICVTSNAIYYSMSDGYCKTDWRGRVLKKKLMFKNDYHVGDLCHHKGRIYTTFCRMSDKAKGFGGDDANRGAIAVLDDDFEIVRWRPIRHGADGITQLDGVLYVALGSDAARRRDGARRGNWYGKYDAETLEPICEPFYVDHGYDSLCGAQNLATDGKDVYATFYVPDETAGTPRLVVFDTAFRVKGMYAYTRAQGLDFVPGGKGGAVRFVWNETLNWLASNDGLDKYDRPRLQALLRFFELKDGKITDITRTGTHYGKEYER